MKVNRRLLSWGVFFVAAGGVMLLATSSLVDDEQVARLLGLWPLLVIGLGIGLLLRRTRFDLAGSMLAAAMPGVLLGGLVVATPRMAPECGDIQAASMVTRQGAFAGAASVNLVLACGDLSVTTTPGSSWLLEAGNGRGAAAVVDSSGDRLSITSADREPMFGLVRGADVWRLALPTATTLDLAAEVNAGHGRLDLAGARLGDVRLTVNAGEARVDLGGATVAHLSTNVNAGRESLLLPGGIDFDADLSVNAGALAICAPGDLGLRIRDQVVLGSTRYAGLVRAGDAWESPDYATASHRADVTISVNVGSVEVNPVGGCK